MTTEPIESDPIPLTVPEAVTEAAHVLAALGLVTAFGHVSARLDTECVVVTPPRPLGGVRAADLIRVQLDAAALPFGAPPETWAHLAVYAARPDVAAVVRAMPPSAFAAALLARDRALRPQHGQGAWLGNAIPAHGLPRLLRTPALADAAARTLGPASAVVLRGNGALTTGPSPSVAVTRMWLLDAPCVGFGSRRRPAPNWPRRTSSPGRRRRPPWWTGSGSTYGRRQTTRCTRRAAARLPETPAGPKLYAV